MLELASLKQIAQQVLMVSTPTGKIDNTLWDRAQRRVRNVEQLCCLPEIIEHDLPIDRFCLVIAAYFENAGVTRCSDDENAVHKLILENVNTVKLRAFSAQVLIDKLSGILSDQKIDKTNKIIIESENRFTNMIEARILSDARNLDDIGAIGIFNEFWRYVANGNGVSDTLKSWKRKIDYAYWQARLKESFHFESTRKIAAQRFSAAEYFMNRLSIENTANDLEEASMKS